MSFEALEASLASGKPVRLYLFERDTLRWRYASADRDIEHAGFTWKQAPISDDGIRQTGEDSADVIKVTGPADLAVAQQYRPVAPSAEVAVTIIDVHYGDAAGRVRFVGSVSGVIWPQDDRCEISLAPFDASLEQTGLRHGYQRNCPYTVYDADCKADKEAKRVNVTLTAVTATTLSSTTFAGFADGYFAGGFIEWDIGSGVIERRGVESHTGATLVLIGLTAGLEAGMTVSAFPGCAGTIAVCDSKFGNKDNFGGIPHLAGSSPFDGSPIF